MRDVKWNQTNLHEIYTHELRVRMDIPRQTSNISRTVISNKIVDHSDVVGALPVGRDNCKMRRKSFKFWDLVHIRDSTVKNHHQSHQPLANRQCSPPNAFPKYLLIYSSTDVNIPWT